MTWCGAAVSVVEQFPEDGLVTLKHIAIECDFNGILNYRKIVNIFKLH
jgi:hypothetical protein